MKAAAAPVGTSWLWTFASSLCFRTVFSHAPASLRFSMQCLKHGPALELQLRPGGGICVEAFSIPRNAARAASGQAAAPPRSAERA
jgi:hypothetical protein